MIGLVGQQVLAEHGTAVAVADTLDSLEHDVTQRLNQRSAGTSHQGVLASFSRYHKYPII